FRYWQQRFGGDPGIVNRPININNIAFTVIGVTPQGFDGAMQVGSSLDVTIPIAWESQINPERSNMKGQVWWLRVMGRLKPGATAEQVRASREGLFQQAFLEHRTVYQAK